MAPFLITSDHPHRNIPNFLSRDAMLARYCVARYILCHGPVFVCPSVWLGTEGPRDAKSCRGTRVATLSSKRPIAQMCSSGVVGPCMWPIVTDVQLCCTVCPSTRSVAIGAMVEQPGGQHTGSVLLF